MLRLSALMLLLVLALAVPGSAFAQNAGDDQYQDPFGDTAGQTDDGGGLSDAPPGGGGGGDTAGESGNAAPPSTPAPAPAPAPGTPPGTAAPATALPNTGSDARLLALLAVSMLMIGVGLRLRTIDPDAF